MIQMPELREIPLSSGWFRRKAADFLEARGLSLDANLDTLFGLYDAEDRLAAAPDVTAMSSNAWLWMNL